MFLMYLFPIAIWLQINFTFRTEFISHKFKLVWQLLPFLSHFYFEFQSSASQPYSFHSPLTISYLLVVATMTNFHSLVLRFHLSVSIMIYFCLRTVFHLTIALVLHFLLLNFQFELLMLRLAIWIYAFTQFQPSMYLFTQRAY